MASNKSNGIEPSDWARAPAVESGPFWQRCLKIIYNPKEKSFFGRTAKRWGIVFAFYTVFYVVLAAMFACCMVGLKSTLYEDRPKWTLDNSLIGSSPGISYRPVPLKDGPQVKYDKSKPEEYIEYIKQLEDLINNHTMEIDDANTTDCLAVDNFGYPDNPCFYIKLNKLYDWIPNYYDKSSLPDDMPLDLADHIKAETIPAQIWMSCEDKSGTNTTITYPFGRALPSSTYPYKNQKGYKSPVFAVKFTPPPNKDVSIRCRAWAKNILHNPSLKEPRGYALISLHVIDTATTP